MKYVSLFLVIVTQSSFAVGPTSAVMISCLLGHSISTDIGMNNLASANISEQENYRSGYDATYYFKAESKEIGYAKKGRRNALIYEGNIFPIDTATVLPDTHMQPHDFNPFLASWSQITDATGRYLCVSFNFDGLGRSGSYQDVRGGYLLSILKEKKGRKLYFSARNTAIYKEK